VKSTIKKIYSWIKNYKLNAFAISVINRYREKEKKKMIVVSVAGGSQTEIFTLVRKVREVFR